MAGFVIGFISIIFDYLIQFEGVVIGEIQDETNLEIIKKKIEFQWNACGYFLNSGILWNSKKKLTGIQWNSYGIFFWDYLKFMEFKEILMGFRLEAFCSIISPLNLPISSPVKFDISELSIFCFCFAPLLPTFQIRNVSFPCRLK